MIKFRALTIIATAAILGTGCGLSHGNAGGTYISPEDAASTVVLHVVNRSSESLELRTVENGQSLFIGSVGAADSTALLLDPSLFPTATLYVLGVPASGRGRASVGPISATKGQQINLTVEPSLGLSHATVVP
ncbi:MAG TPA: hypothetical protein VGM67_13490 [Gemmatimonadaceae bacterium]|jgi:hypothetical protein